MADFNEILEPAALATPVTVNQVLTGIRIPPQQQIFLYSAEQWETLVQEWAFYALKFQYAQVQRFTGAGDQGIDIAGFTDDKKLQGVWDCYQCKKYGDALTPTVAWPEIGKILWYTFNGEYSVPRKYFFVAPKGVGTKLNRFLANAANLKNNLIENWDKNVRSEITETQEVSLEGKLFAYVQAFDFAIFGSKTPLEIVEDHRKHSPFHSMRFGGGLPQRPAPTLPPTEVSPEESRYIGQLLKAYGDHKKQIVCDIRGLSAWPSICDHFGRQREAFYHAESLRIFARDSVPPGTFEALQDEIHAGVIDTHDDDHADGYERVKKVTKAARDLQITCNALVSCAKVQDRAGICHQLANESRFQWTKP